jgi:2-succinyl-6-hydroxy-2,4-cyclohexadiene-1-carboxylate synthase
MPRVVLVPGFTQTSSSWRDVITVLDESCEVVPFEIPARDTIEATVSALDARGRRAIYVGYSMGARLCLRLALDRPANVLGLVLVSASPGIADPEARAARIASDEDLARSIARVGVPAFIDEWLAQPMFATVPPDAAGVDDRRALSAAYLAHCLRVLGAGSFEPMWEELRNLRMPVALVTGRGDQRYDAIAEEMRERIGSEAVRVRLEGGHALPLENPGVLGEFIAAFAQEHG